jgi:hypothetical protein
MHFLSANAIVRFKASFVPMHRNEVIESAGGTIPATIFALVNTSPSCRSAINGYVLNLLV